MVRSVHDASSDVLDHTNHQHLASISSFFLTAAIFIQQTLFSKQSTNHIRRRRPDGSWKIHHYGSKTYAFFGWTLFAIGNITRFLSMRFAAQMVLSGLGSLQFVIIPIASRSLLGIQPQASTILGITVVLFGNMLIISYGPSTDSTFTLCALRHQWSTPPMQSFLFILVSFLVMLYVAWRVIHKHRRLVEAEQRALHAMDHRRLNESSCEAGEVLLVSSSSSFIKKDAVHNNGTDHSNNNKNNNNTTTAVVDPSALRTFIAALLFSIVSSIIGAWSVLFSKSLTYIINDAPGSMKDWYSWFAIVAFISTAAYWIKQSNKGLKLYPATLIMPLMQAFWMTMSVLEGMIYFDEIKGLESSWEVMMLGVGLVMAIVGAVAMGLTEYLNQSKNGEYGVELNSNGDGDGNNNGYYSGSSSYHHNHHHKHKNSGSV